MSKLPDSINFPQEEENVLELWKKLDVFNNCLKQSKGKPRYSFYDGPPFATGLPHYGHILAGTIKDIVTRYDKILLTFFFLNYNLHFFFK